MDQTLRDMRAVYDAAFNGTTRSKGDDNGTGDSLNSIGGVCQYLSTLHADDGAAAAAVTHVVIAFKTH